MLSQPFFLPALLIGVGAIPLILRLVPRNRFYGIRTAAALSGDALWYRTNQRGGVALLVSSLIYIVFAYVFPMAGRHDPMFVLWLQHLAAFVIPTAVFLFLLLRYAK